MLLGIGGAIYAGTPEQSERQLPLPAHAVDAVGTSDKSREKPDKNAKPKLNSANTTMSKTVSNHVCTRKTLFVHLDDPQPEWAVNGAQCLFDSKEFVIISTGSRGAMIANNIGRIHGWVKFKDLTCRNTNEN